MNSHITKSQHSEWRKSPQRLITFLKFQKTGNRKPNKASREKKNKSHQGIKIRMALDFTAELLETRSQWTKVLKI